MNSQISVIEPEALEYLPAATMLKIIEKQQKAAKNFKAFQATVTSLPALFRALEEMDIPPTFDGDYDYMGLSFTGDGKKLGDVWGLLRRNGYKTDARPQKGDTTFYAFWEHERLAKIFMNFTSSVCRRVKVGTRMVEQDIYETQCGELPEIDAPATAVVAQEDGSDIPF